MTSGDSQMRAMSFGDLIYGLFSGDLFGNLNKDELYDETLRNEFKEINFLRCRYHDYPR
jgi:hypothetical protein